MLHQVLLHHNKLLHKKKPISSLKNHQSLNLLLKILQVTPSNSKEKPFLKKVFKNLLNHFLHLYTQFLIFKVVKYFYFNSFLSFQKELI